MSKKQCMNKKLHPYYKTGIYGWIGEEVDDNDYIICPICGNVLGMNYWDYQAENDGDNKCPECEQELDYSEIYDFEDTCYFEQLLEIKESKITDLEAKLAESEKKYAELFCKNTELETLYSQKTALLNFYKDNDLVKENSQLKQQLAEKDAELEEVKQHRTQILNFGKRTKKVVIVNPYGEDCVVYNQEDQDKISFAVDILEELADCSNYIDSKLDFESGSYVSEKVIRDKIKYLKGNKYE